MVLLALLYEAYQPAVALRMLAVALRMLAVALRMLAVALRVLAVAFVLLLARRKLVAALRAQRALPLGALQLERLIQLA
jgi:hypothetical protein